MRRRRLLVADDEEGMLEVCQDTLERLDDVEVFVELESPRAAARLRDEPFDMLITDIRMPVLDGVALLRVAREQDPDIPVLMITGFPTVESAVETLRAGMVDYLVKPFLPDDLLAKTTRFLEERRLRQENALLARLLSRDFEPASAPAADVRLASETDGDALITGGDLTERELAARAVHGERRSGRFVPVNCRALSSAALERELLGYEKGAFEGARTRGLGLLEFAAGGTLFLGEIDRLTSDFQAKLSRILADRRFLPLGGTVEVPLNVRLVAGAADDPERLDLLPELLRRLSEVRVGLPAGSR
jgi:DNA-binding NtrC family response regulator